MHLYIYKYILLINGHQPVARGRGDGGKKTFRELDFLRLPQYVAYGCGRQTRKLHKNHDCAANNYSSNKYPLMINEQYIPCGARCERNGISIVEMASYV